MIAWQYILKDWLSENDLYQSVSLALELLLHKHFQMYHVDRNF